MSKLLNLSNDVKVSLDSVDLTIASGTINTYTNDYGIMQNATYVQFGKVVVLSFEFLTSKKEIPSYGTVKIASGLPNPSNARRCIGAILDGIDCKVFYQIDTDGNLTLYNRNTIVIPSGNMVRSYGLVYEI
jgi:hypothetical protein